MAVDSDGNAMIRSGGKGGSFTVGEQKAEIKGPEVEIDGKITRTEFFALAGEIGMAAGGVGGTVWMGQEQSEVLSPEIEVNGKKVRRTVSADPKEAKLWSGTAEGTTVSSDDEKALVLGPKGKGSITVDEGKVKLVRPNGKVSLELTDILAQILGPQSKGVLSLTEDLVEMIGRDEVSLLRLADGLAEFVGPDGQKALKLGHNIVQLLGGLTSNLTMAEAMVNFSGFGSGLRMTPLFSEFASPFLGAFRMLPGISEVSGGGNSMVVSTAGVYFAVGGAILGLAASGMAAIGNKKSSFRNGDEESESGVGMILDPQENKAALVAYHRGEWNRPNSKLPDNLDQPPSGETDNSDWENQSSRVFVSDQTVYIQSISIEGEILSEIQVGPEAITMTHGSNELIINNEGVLVNSKNIKGTDELEAELADLKRRVDNLESSGS
jgi:hypothetical protein